MCVVCRCYSQKTEEGKRYVDYRVWLLQDSARTAPVHHHTRPPWYVLHRGDFARVPSRQRSVEVAGLEHRFHVGHLWWCWWGEVSGQFQFRQHMLTAARMFRAAGEDTHD